MTLCLHTTRLSPATRVQSGAPLLFAKIRLSSLRAVQNTTLVISVHCGNRSSRSDSSLYGGSSRAFLAQASFSADQFGAERGSPRYCARLMGFSLRSGAMLSGYIRARRVFLIHCGLSPYMDCNLPCAFDTQPYENVISTLVLKEPNLPTAQFQDQIRSLCDAIKIRKTETGVHYRNVGAPR